MKTPLIICLIAIIALSGCTTMRPLDTRDTTLAEELASGDHLVIYEKSGRIVDMTYSHSDDTSLRGAMADNAHRPIAVNIDDIQRVEIEKIDGARTTLAVVGGTIIAVPLLLIAGFVGGMAGY